MLIDLTAERPYKDVPSKWLEQEMQNAKNTIGLTQAFLETMEYEQECRSTDELRELQQQQMDDLVKEAKPSEDLIK